MIEPSENKKKCSKNEEQNCILNFRLIERITTRTLVEDDENFHKLHAAACYPCRQTHVAALWPQFFHGGPGIRTPSLSRPIKFIIKQCQIKMRVE